MSAEDRPVWPLYKKYNEIIDEDEYIEDQEHVQNKKKRHDKHNGVTLWHETSEIAANDIIEGMLNKSINFMTLVAEPGSGKTAVVHNLIYRLLTSLPYENAINPTNITILTGMSDTDWYEQIIDNFTLNNKKYLWEEMDRIDINSCIVHRSNFHKRITYILKNLELLHDHTFIVDESNIADSPSMTIDSELLRLGLTLERMVEYNIKIICISATPDVNLSIMSRSGNHYLIKLEQGPNYKGFRYFNDTEMIQDFVKNLQIDTIIGNRYTSPRYHFIRARTSNEKGQYQQEIKDIALRNNWILIEDDSDNNYYLSFKEDSNEKQAIDKNKDIIKTYIQPLRHSFILIKDKYSASKRLKLTSYTGLIIEKPAKQRNTSSTCNGLIPRFWMYGEEPLYINNELPLFICDYKAVKEYIMFSETFILNGKDYTSNRLISKKNKITEKKNTCYSMLAGEDAITRDSKIGIYSSNDFIKINEELSKHIRGTEVSIESFNQRDGFYFPKRNVPRHTFTNELDEYMIEETYKKYKCNGGGSFINRRHDGEGQRFMIYPVYKEIGSSELTWYLHYYIIE